MAAENISKTKQLPGEEVKFKNKLSKTKNSTIKFSQILS